MTKVSFYVLQADAPGSNGRLGLACRIAEKALRASVGSGQRAYIHCPDEATLNAMDDLLWTFRQGSFVAHERLNDVRDWNDTAPVIIGSDEPPQELNAVLINLAQDVPLFFSRFERVAEVIDDAGRETGRQRYQFYKDRGYPLETHKIGAE
ncbi:MAG: DNA polymerase III subunit chi [Nevskiales bacterium]